MNKTMVNWSGIEDAAHIPSRVWLTREKDTDEWKPLSKVDCQRLNENSIGTESTNMPLLIDYGRATANPELGCIHYHFFPKPDQPLIYAHWFYRIEEDPNNNNNNHDKSIKYILEPVTDLPISDAIEDLYQRAVHASSTLGNGLDEILKEQIPIPDTQHHIAIGRDGDGSCIVRKCPNGTWFCGKSIDIQRGYGPYTNPGEIEELTLGPVNHIIFVIHGIGEAMWSRNDITYTGSLGQDITNFRRVMQKRQIEEWKRSCKIAKRETLPEPPPPNRVELIPILWYDRVHNSSSTLMKSLQATTIKTIPALREIANDVIFDVLMYMTPTFCYDVLDCVTEQIIQQLALYQKHNPEFNIENGGKCSLMGHSLGSVICWDLLTILNDSQNTTKESVTPKEGGEHWVHIANNNDGRSTDIGYQSYASQGDANHAKNGNVGPSLPRQLKRTLPFEPQHTIFLGSPIGLFLTLRGAHPVFDALRNNLPPGPGRPKASPFRLPSKGIHNIFHPSDPVAYRIEPLLLVQGTPHEEFPTPQYLTKEGEDVRLHIKAKQLGDHIRRSIIGKSLIDTKPSLSSFFNAVSDHTMTFLQQIDDKNNRLTDAEPAGVASRGSKQEGGNDNDEEDIGKIRFPLAGGRSGRLDFQLQPNLIDSEYVSAVLAHCSYFTNTDVIDYTIELARR